MQDNSPKPRKNLGDIITYCIVGGIIIFTAILALYPQALPQKTLQVSDLPLQKFNEGYDIICESKGDNELCLLNQTSRIIVSPMVTLHLKDKAGNYVNVNVFEINGTKKGYCVKQWSSLWNNTANTECDDTVAFDKSLWIASTLPDVNGKETLIAFTHDGVKRTQ